MPYLLKKVPFKCGLGYNAASQMETQKKEIIKGLPIEELEAKMVAIGQPAFRGRQLFSWIYSKREADFSKMTDMNKEFRAYLNEKYELPTIKVVEEQHSSDGTAKYLVQLADGEKVESVFIPSEDRATLCVSTQVGCKMACTFCATGYQKFTRDLKAWEIVEQLTSIQFPKPVTNIVMMGMGEPFDNYDEVIKALKILQHPMGVALGKRHITVSTVGLNHNISRFVDANLGKLAISLHGTTDEQRSKLMPINKKYPIKSLMDVCRNLNFKGKLRVTFEYILFAGLNDSDEDAYRLIELVKGIPNKINLLAYNENDFIDFKRPSEERILRFQNILLAHNLTATYRRSRGRDIAAACGQLKTLKTKRPAPVVTGTETIH